MPGRDLSSIRLDAVMTAVRIGDIGRVMTIRHAQLVGPAQDLCDRVEASVREQLAKLSLRDFIATGAPDEQVQEVGDHLLEKGGGDEGEGRHVGTFGAGERGEMQGFDI